MNKNVAAKEYDNQSNKTRLRYRNVRLPTPPPDPTQSPRQKSQQQNDNELLDYILSFNQKLSAGDTIKQCPLEERTNQLFAQAKAADDAFDHLEKLYKLMEQLLNLREQNCKLQKRVRDLEHFKIIQDIRQNVHDLESEPFAEHFLDNILSAGKTASYKRSKSGRFRQSLLGKSRNRSCSMVIDDFNPYPDSFTYSDGNIYNNRTSKTSKVSKWKKVKAAFKWEKAASTSTDAVTKSQDSGLGLSLNNNHDVAKYLRVPSITTHSSGVSPADSVLSGQSSSGLPASSKAFSSISVPETPASLSSASSVEDIQHETDENRKNDDRSARNRLSTCSDESSLREHRRSKSFDDDTPFQKEQWNTKSMKTPWGKVKDIIQTRKDSLKKTESSKMMVKYDKRDQYSNDFCSVSSEEFPDVFDKNDIDQSVENVASKSINTKSSKRSTPLLTITIPKDLERYQTETTKTAGALPADIIKRYQDLIFQDKARNQSRWCRVKKAFLHKHDFNKCSSTPSSPLKQSVFFPDDADDHQMSGNCQRSLERQQLHEEIRKNYEELQNKLSLEFQEKLLEWERLKTMPSTSSSSQNDPDNCGDADRKVMTTKSNSDHLSADFKKKLQEWQKIKKEQTCGSPLSIDTKKKDWQLFTKTPPSSPFKYPDTTQLSQDFLKKLDEWKRMKATNTVPSYSGNDDEYFGEHKLSSPRFKRKQSSGTSLKSPQQSTKKMPTKPADNKELQVLEKEIQKIEKEKQRLEREREKYLDREERLAKLRRTVSGNQQKKEVLVQTSTGFFRFEGISRKFTQRLYEWEKARGIGPEESTLSLLNPAYRPQMNTNKLNESQSSRLIRSKSMDSVANITSMSNAAITHQPSSLSLNDMEHLEAECMIGGTAHLGDDLELLEDGPEAVIVDIEDVVEETAAPLDTNNIGIPVCVTHTPVYCYEQQQANILCEGEECLAPKVQGVEEKHTSYSLIEENIKLLNKLKDKEDICQQLETGIEDINSKVNTIEEKQNNEIEQMEYETQLKRNDSQCSERQFRIQELERKKKRLKSEEINLHNSFIEHKAEQSKLAQHLVGSMRRLHEANSTTNNDNSMSTNQRIVEVTEMVQDLSSELLNLAEKLEQTFNNCETVGSTNKKHMKQWQSVDFGSAGLSTTIDHKDQAKELSMLLINKILELKRGLSYICAATDENMPENNQKEQNEIEKSDSVPNMGKYRRKPFDLETNRRKFKSKSRNDLKYPETDSDNELMINRKLNKRTHNDVRRSPISNCVIETNPQYLKYDQSLSASLEAPGDIFVKTTKTVFLPESTDKNDQSKTILRKTMSSDTVASSLPPLPNSPISLRRLTKDTAPSIRLMIAKYNQRLCEQDSGGGRSPGGSSGSASPVAWRSPIFERRVRAQTERYQEEIKRQDVWQRNNITKSASTSLIRTNETKTVDLTIQSKLKGILKSSSASSFADENKVDDNTPPKIHRKFESPGDSTQNSPQCQLRAIKLKQAKEDFLASTPPPKDVQSYRLSQTSESSMEDPKPDGTLTKSASAGMINIDADAFRQLAATSEMHSQGYVSLPRSNRSKDILTAKFGIASITSKFRKVKMRRSAAANAGSSVAMKEPKLNTISMLCRQSLLVDINDSSGELLNQQEKRERSKSTSCSPIFQQRRHPDANKPSTSHSWISKMKKPK